MLGIQEAFETLESLLSRHMEIAVYLPLYIRRGLYDAPHVKNHYPPVSRPFSYPHFLLPTLVLEWGLRMKSCNRRAPHIHRVDDSLSE